MKKDKHGFTLIELLIGGVVASFLLMGAYRLFIASTSQVGKTVSNTRGRAAVEKILDQIASQIRNSYDISDTSISLRLNKAPLNCGDDAHSSSIVAFPGMDKTAIENLTTSAIDPSTANISAEADGIRVAYVPSDSYPTDLVGIEISSGLYKPYPSNDAANYKINIGDKVAYQNMNVGDFFILSDTDGIRLGRIT
ncbi:MAG TPA: prepilin-type N-terminal cleavage/methylation domain-containing protein, partial [Oligoflexia bacterium]|nr:prepilin-type N-terminal cleavage/methylation domain-containing protein [Oligoflexia bacterium]HMR25251.1 prepilin-type N-terminal cleavage/methylation domain-containing protein [Oligoflexia bacterium]